MSDNPPGVVFLTNASGDVYVRVVDGHEEAVDPDGWGWGGGGQAEDRKSVEEIQGLPGFTVEIQGDAPKAVPGPKPKRPGKLFEWKDGSAPAALARSKAATDDGTLGRYDRLSAALGYAAWSLPRNPQSNPFHVNDLVGGRLFVISYEPPLNPDGIGFVYVVEDGLGIKIGHTTGPPALRIGGLQTGNPRLISTIAIVASADPTVEDYLHTEFSRWLLRGEWFDRSQLLAMARDAGGWGNLIRVHLPERDWRITVYPPYA